MTKHVYIIVHGEHFIDGAPQEPVEVTAEGRYYFRGGKHYLLYDEFPGEDTPRKTQERDRQVSPGVTSSMRSGEYQVKDKIENLVKFNDTFLETHKKGGTESLMRFEKDKMHMTQYRTPAGVLELGTRATNLSLETSPHKIKLTVEYSLHAGGMKVQDSRVTITVLPYPVV